MKAGVWEQRSLLELSEVDAELGRIAHRTENLPEQKGLEQVQASYQEANDRLAAVGLALEDLDAAVSKFEAEIDSVRQRENRDRSLLDGGSVNAKQVGDLQHELETLQRRQGALEDSLLEVMERREELQGNQEEALARIDELEVKLTEARGARETALKEISQSRHRCASRRDELTAGLDRDLLSLYERQRAKGGAGAASLQGRRCGACRIEIDRGEISRITAAAEDDVVRCPECGAILLRVEV